MRELGPLERDRVTGTSWWVAVNRRFAKLRSMVSPYRDVVLAVVSAIIGGVIAHGYYQQSLSDMKADAEKREREVQLILHAIESVGTIKYHRDADGKVSGVVIELAALVKGAGAVSGLLSVSDPEGISK